MVLLRNLSHEVQGSVHEPSPFLCAHLHRLLPTWQSPLGSAIVLLQRCSMSLSCRTHHTEQEKDLLRDRFFHLGNIIAEALMDRGFEVELFDPKTGVPVRSPKGFIKLDDVAVARAALGYPVRQKGGCIYLVHPQWGDGVYPTTMVSSAPHPVAQKVLDTVIVTEECSRHGICKRNHQQYGFDRALNGLTFWVKSSLI